MITELKLRNFPISFYAIILGLAGFTVAWQKAESFFGIGNTVSSIIGITGLILFLVISAIYIIKWIKFPQEVKAEFHNPVKINFFPIIAKIFLLGSIILVGLGFHQVAQNLWIIGVILQLGFTFILMYFWMNSDKFELKHISPALFIPIVGNILIPIVGVEFYSAEISWFFFSVGFFLWIIFMIIVFYRIIFAHPLPEKLVPTFFILMAPPAIGFISYVKLTGDFDVFARMMYYFSLFLFFVLLTQIVRFFKIRFFLSWWAYSFPLDALVIATFFAYHQTGMEFFKFIGLFMFALLNILIVFLIFKTAKAISKGHICIEEND